MNIVTGKMGRSTFFNRHKWGANAGNNEFPILISAIAKLNPKNTYYFIGKSDLSRSDKSIYDFWFPHGNVVDVWKGFNPKQHDPTTWVVNQLEGIDIDYGIIHGGMCSLSIPNRIYCLDRKTGKPIVGKLRSPIQSLVNYVSPITYYLNESGIDWLTITSDGRYMPLPARDLINPEKISLGVREGTIEIERMKSYEDQETMVKHKVELRYGFAEFQYLLDNKWNNFRFREEKTQKVALFFHQYDNKKRIRNIQEVIDIFKENEIAVYGKWDVEDNSKYKGPVTFDELQEILPAVKYTFCYPIIDGDISGKWVEAVTNGIIPFFHDSYDKDRLLVKYHNIPSWLYVKSAAEMKEKVDYLESNNLAYNKMKNILVSSVSNFPKNGAKFVNLINQAVNDMKKM
jgi:hypothetical protein